jgi:hypothetical protein
MAELSEIEVSAPQYEIINSSKELNLFLAGVGSGKSHTMGIKSANYVLNFPDAPGLITANTYQQLSHSTLVRVYAVWAQYFGLIEDVHFVVDKQPPPHFKRRFENLKKYSNVISFQNGARIFLASLERYKSIDGMEVAWAMMDETKDTREEAFKETIIARLRSPGIWIDSDNELWDHVPSHKEVVGFNPIDIFTSPAKVGWLNKMFYVDKHLKEIKSRIFSKHDFYVGEFEDRKIVIASTYHNEHNLPENYIPSRKAVWDDTPGLTETLLFASPVGKSGGEYYAQFLREKHVKGRLEINPDLPVHLMFDFNVVPFMPALMGQIDHEEDGTMVIRILKEYCLKHPKNTTGSVCQQMLFDMSGVVDLAYIYGDASGKNRVTALMDQKSPKHNYDVIKAKLAPFLFSGSMRVPKANPPIAGRRIMHNRIFSGNHNVRVEIDERCVNFIEDLEVGKEGPNGEYLKQTVKDPRTGKSYQKNGHLSDAFTYFCWKHLEHLIKIQ